MAISLIANTFYWQHLHLQLCDTRTAFYHFKKLEAEKVTTTTARR